MIVTEYNSDSHVLLNFEIIRVGKQVKYELDLVNLFDSKQPFLYKLEDGKYMIDVASTFNDVNKFNRTIKKVTWL